MNINGAVVREIDADPEAFQDRVRAYAYAIAMAKHDEIVTRLIHKAVS